MNDSSGSGRPPQPPRKELQGPRPAPLKVRKDSHKIKKLQPVPPPPVIIYAVSPKIIHTNPSDFMNLVQRLTGPDNSTATSNPPPSPAARLASIEKTKIPLESRSTTVPGLEHLMGTRPGPGNSILSPGPGGLIQPVPPALFSDPFSPLINLYHQHQHDHLNTLQQLQNSGAGNFMSPTMTFLSPTPMLSPASIEFLTRILDQ